MTGPNYLLDSNICIYIMRSLSRHVRARLAEQDAGNVGISSLTLAEISVGFEGDARSAPELAIFLEEVPVLPFDEPAAFIYGTLPFRRRNLIDRLLAAHALSLNLTVVTNNEADFADVPGLRVENWTLPA